MRGKESDLPYGLDLLDERATAFHDCICFMRQAYPNFGITTYDRTVHRGAEQIVLAKFVTGIGRIRRYGRFTKILQTLRPRTISPAVCFRILFFPTDANTISNFARCLSGATKPRSKIRCKNIWEAL